MRRWKRLIYYLSINVLVLPARWLAFWRCGSACANGAARPLAMQAEGTPVLTQFALTTPGLVGAGSIRIPAEGSRLRP
jgi:hypothetical protein